MPRILEVDKKSQDLGLPIFSFNYISRVSERVGKSC